MLSPERVERVGAIEDGFTLALGPEGSEVRFRLQFGSQCSLGCSLCSVLGGPLWPKGSVQHPEGKHLAPGVASAWWHADLRQDADGQDHHARRGGVR